MNLTSRHNQKIRRYWAIFCIAIKKFSRIDGSQWAGAFAFNAFFSLFPLMILLVTLASSFVDQDMAVKRVIVNIEKYIPISGETQRHIFDIIEGVVKGRRQAGAVASLILISVALQCFTTLICATNRAWGTEATGWWRLPLKSLVLLGIITSAVLFGMASPVLMRIVEGWIFPTYNFSSWIYGIGSFFILLLLVFFGLSLFYMLAPRRPAHFSQVWIAALWTTALLQIAERLFVIYLKNFASFNAVYGAFGGIMALLLWIYLSGCIFIFGACLCAAQAEKRSASPDTIMAC